MSGTVAPLLLRIAAAVDGDGAAAVRAVLEAVLQERVPFEAGEIVYARSLGEHASFPLGQDPEPFLGRDLLEHVLEQGTPLRIDDLRDAAPFPETLARLRRLGLRSVLVLPFRFGDPSGPGLRGALALARSQGWAFAGASLPLLVPVAGQAGLSFDHALRLSAFGGRASSPIVAGARSPAAPLAAAAAPADPGLADPSTAKAEAEAARAAAAALRVDLEAVRSEAARAAEALRESAEKMGALRTSLETAEAGRLEAERSRDGWAQQAATLRSKVEEQAAEIQRLTRISNGARESAAAAAEVVEAREVRIRELEAAFYERDRVRASSPPVEEGRPARTERRRSPRGRQA